MIRVLFDIDVLLDVLEPRADFYLDSFCALNLCDSGLAQGWICADSHSTIHYFLRKQLGDFEARQKMIGSLASLAVIPIRRGTLLKALESELPDFEDNIKIIAAQTLPVDFIITRNIRHYKQSPVTALTPAEFVQKARTGFSLPKENGIPFIDLKAQYHQIYNAIDDKITDIIARSAFIRGNYVEAFEEAFAAAQGARYCIGLSTGTDALHLALLALEIGPGDAVIVPVNTFFATAEAVMLTGARCVFIDHDAFFHLDVNQLEILLARSKGSIENCHIRAIIPVHLYGQAVNMDPIMALAHQYDLAVIEDCAQAHLAAWGATRVGNFGAFGAFSFYPGKNLGAFGEGGALITNDSALHAKARSMHQHGESKRYHHQYAGHNYRMENIQGAVLDTKLTYLPEWTARRQQNAALYNELLADIPEIQTPDIRPAASHVFHLYVIRTPRRDALQKHLQEKGVATGLHYPLPLHLQEACHSLGYARGDFPQAEAAAAEILSLPMFPELREEQIRYVCGCVREFF